MDLLHVRRRTRFMRGSGKHLAARFRSGGTSRVAIAAMLALALMVTAGALVVLGGHHRVDSATRAISSREQLIDAIAVLRRPQTSADLHSATIARLLSGYNPKQEPWDAWGAPDRPLIRRAAVTPWGEAVFLVPLKPTSGHGQEAMLWTTRSFIEGSATATDVKTFGEVNSVGQVKRRIGGREEVLGRFVAVVPNGVAKVLLGRLVMRVHDNVAAAQANGKLVGATPVMLWFGPDGNAIRRIGFVAGRYRSFAVK